MVVRYTISSSGLGLIKRLEGFRADAARLDNGRWVIGHGHVFASRPDEALGVKEAELLLRYDLRAIAIALDGLIFTPLTQNQIDALSSFAYNIGLEVFAESDVLSLINQGALVAAATAMEAWCRADLRGQSMIVDGLVRRRAAEKALFLTPEGGWRPAPSHILVPRAQGPDDLDLAAPHISIDLAEDLLESPFDPRRSRPEPRNLMLDLDVRADVDWPRKSRTAAPGASARGSGLVMAGAAIASLGAIGASGASRGLGVLPDGASHAWPILVVWLFGLGGIVTLALIVRSLLQRLFPRF